MAPPFHIINTRVKIRGLRCAEIEYAEIGRCGTMMNDRNIIQQDREPVVEQHTGDTTEHTPSYAMLMAGEIETGKTHTLLLMADAVLDLEDRAHIPMRKFTTTPYVHKPTGWADTVRTVKKWAAQGDIHIIGIDTARLLEVQAQADAEKEIGHKLVSGMGNAGQYSRVYARIKDLISIVRSAGKSIILTCHMKPEYVDDKRTGRMVYEAPRNMDRTMDFIISSVHGPMWPGTAPLGFPRDARWYRVDKDCVVWKYEQPPYIIAHVPRNRATGRVPIFARMVSMLEQPVVDEAEYWDMLEKEGRGSAGEVIE